MFAAGSSADGNHQYLNVVSLSRPGSPGRRQARACQQPRLNTRHCWPWELGAKPDLIYYTISTPMCAVWCGGHGGSNYYVFTFRGIIL